MNNLDKTITAINEYFAGEMAETEARRACDCCGEKAHRDYMVYCDDATVPEQIQKTKAQAIKAAKTMAKKYNTDAIVLPCINFQPDDFSPHYWVSPSGEITTE